MTTKNLELAPCAHVDRLNALQICIAPGHAAQPRLVPAYIHCQCLMHDHNDTHDSEKLEMPAKSYCLHDTKPRMQKTSHQEAKEWQYR